MDMDEEWNWIRWVYDPSYIAQGEQLNQKFHRRLGIQSNSG